MNPATLYDIQFWQAILAKPTDFVLTSSCGVGMLKAGDVLDLTPIGAVFHVVKTATDTQGSSFEMEWELAPRTGGTPIHIHPAATESYEVSEGLLELCVDGKWTTLSPGERVSVPPGVPHTFRNSSDLPARVYNTHAPAMNFDEYFAALDRIVNSGVIRNGRTTPKAILYLAVLMTSFEDEIRSVNPPHAIMKMAARVGKLLGYQV